MGKAAALKVVNPVLGVLLVSQLVTGLVGDSLPHEVFEVLHEGGGIALVAMAVLHVILNWSWVRANYLRRK